MNRRCESLEFNPWHALEDHRPVGVMNRLRKAVYQQMSTYRRTKNCAAENRRDVSESSLDTLPGVPCRAPPLRIKFYTQRLDER